MFWWPDYLTTVKRSFIKVWTLYKQFSSFCYEHKDSLVVQYTIQIINKNIVIQLNKRKTKLNSFKQTRRIWNFLESLQINVHSIGEIWCQFSFFVLASFRFSFTFFIALVANITVFIYIVLEMQPIFDSINEAEQIIDGSECFEYSLTIYKLWFLQ